MVCSIVKKMTTLLEGGSRSKIMAEDVGCWKLAVQYIQRELKEADEVNLLDEEDMHVFGLRPTVDPLILVSCNSCKKPVKVSQYAKHTEICESLTSQVDSTTDTDVARKKKPPRKEKKKLQMNEQTQKETSLPAQPKGTESLNESQARSLKNFDDVNSHQTPTKLNDHHLQTNGMLSVAAPLATRIYYSQRNQRLRSAISHMYYRSSSTQNDHGNMQFSLIDDPLEKACHIII